MHTATPYPVSIAFVWIGRPGARLIFIMLQEYERLYDDLRLNYQLLFIHDIEPYHLHDLRSLAGRLQSHLELDAKEHSIHQELILKSRKNVEKRLAEKRMAQEMKREQRGKRALVDPVKVEKPARQEEKAARQEEKAEAAHREEEDDYINENYINESAIIDFPTNTHDRTYREVKSIQGKIYGGRQLIELTVATFDSKTTQKAQFEIAPDEDRSTINPTTLRKLCCRVSTEVSLMIEGKAALAQVVEKEYNAIGMAFLRDHNVIIRSNFRPENSTFSLIFTL